MDEHLRKQSFNRSITKPTLYVRESNGYAILIVALYIDDLLIIGPKNEFLGEFNNQMKKDFEMTDLRQMTYFLGMEYIQNSNKIFVHQYKYAKDILRRFKMELFKLVYTLLSIGDNLSKNDGAIEANSLVYKSMIGSLLYVSTTRPDIMFATSLLSRFMQ